MTPTLNWSVNLNPSRLSITLDPAELDAAGERAIAHLQDLGARYVRMDFRWGHLMPQPGSPDPRAIAWYRRFLARLEASGIGVYGILYNPPAWAQALSRDELPGFHAAWRAYCTLCAREFGDHVRLWQVWNEPNNYVSHLKDDFNLFDTRAFSMGGWRVTLPVGVRWDALVPLYRIAREELGPDAWLAYNVIANVSEYSPVNYPQWTEWDHFTDLFLARAGDWVDVLALDHYPDTWVPGVGPLAWGPLDTLAQKVHDTRSAWYGKTVVVGEFGYSCFPNVDLVQRPLRIRFFPEDHSEASMADWYAAAIPYVGDRLAPSRWPHNKLHLANVYELFDGTPGEIMEGQHAEVVGIEYHFGLVRRSGEPKPAFDLLRDYLRDGRIPVREAPRRGGTNPLELYMRGSAASKLVHRRVTPALYALFQAVRPPLRKHDAGVLSMGAAWVLYQVWRAATRPSAK